MQPFKTDPDGVPCFSKCDIDDYGFPEVYGFEVYRVIDTREANFVSDYKMERQYDLRPIHRYSRISRFKSTLLKLLGDKNSVPDYIIQAVRVYMKPNSQDPWNEIRKILKHYKWRKYYDFIPSIMSSLKLGTPLKITHNQFEEIMSDYMQISTRFEREKKKYKRKYFPNIRFIVLKLLEKHGIQYPYKVPFARTNRKQKSLTTLWESIQFPKTNRFE